MAFFSKAGLSAYGVHRQSHSLAEVHLREDGIPQCCGNAPTQACTVPFRSLREGKLFLAEAPKDLDAAFDGLRKKVPRREHFWLCIACSTHFTLRFDTDQGVTTVPLEHDLELRWLTRLNLLNC